MRKKHEPTPGVSLNSFSGRMSVNHMVPGATELRRGRKIPRNYTTVTDSCEPLCGFWGSNPGPWEVMAPNHTAISTVPLVFLLNSALWKFS